MGKAAQPVLVLVLVTCQPAASPVAMDEETKTPSGVVTMTDARSEDTPVPTGDDVSTKSSNVPWSMKVIAVLLVTSIGFGSHWASGVTGAMKSTLKKASTYAFLETVAFTILLTFCTTGAQHLQYTILRHDLQQGFHGDCFDTGNRLSD